MHNDKQATTETIYTRILYKQYIHTISSNYIYAVQKSTLQFIANIKGFNTYKISNKKKATIYKIKQISPFTISTITTIIDTL